MKMPMNIGPFKKYVNEPCDIQYGTLYTMDVKLPVPNCKKRTVRVYLPDGYSKDKKYPVIYMSDGQNIVDKYTTAYGAWDIDVRMHELVKEGYSPFIVVGIDCPKIGHMYRAKEYTIQELTSYDPMGNMVMSRGYSNLLIDYVVDILKPLIDKYFATRLEKEFTAFGGSSIGGLAAFNFATKRKETFGFSLSFSPAFFLFDQKELYEYVDSLNINPEEYGKFYFYSGDVGFEHLFLQPTIDMYEYFKSRGFSDKQVALKIDKTQAHCEASWNKHFAEAIKFWLSK